MAQKQKGSRKQLLFQLVMLVFVLVGLLVALYPFYVASLNSFLDQRRIEQVQRISEAEKKAARERMTAENERLADQGMHPGADPFEEKTQKASKEETEKYRIGSVNIPKINVHILLYDRLNEAILEKGAGVLQGTSFPLGGESVHSVISAHSGLPSRRLFTDLEELEIGDTFILTVLGEKLAYEVNNIQVVTPDDTSALKIEEGQDLVTLLTCTPYMINSHRLLVTGHRIPYSESVEEEEGQGNQERTFRQLLILLGTALLTGLILLSLIRGIHRYRLSRKRMDFSFFVQTESGEPVAGRSFVLKHKKRTLTREGQPFLVSSDSKGQIRFEQLPGGTYRIVSTEDPKITASFGVKKLKQEQMHFFEGRKSVSELHINGWHFKIDEASVRRRK